jgi:membrane protein DedA with SNARE-associated domain
MDRFFGAHGNKTILVARFITGLRVFAALLAGSARMPWATFAVYNMLGAVLWSLAISLAGFFFGRSWDALERWIRGAGLVAFGIVVIIAIAIAFKRRRRQKLEEMEAETETERAT